MKKLLFVFAFIIAGNYASAQQNRVVLTLNDFSRWRYEQIFDDTENHLNITGLVLLPSVGYYRLIGKDWGIGAEIGYRPYSYTASSTFLRSSTQYADDNVKTTYHSFFISPAVFEQYAWRKYRFVATMSLPIEFTTNFRTTETISYKDKVTNEEVFHGYGTQAYADRLKAGVFASLSVQRKIAGALYFGAQLGFGINGETVFGDDHYEITQTESGVTTQTHHASQNPGYGVFGFTTRETISLNYYF
jgi:hypothetical protein